MGVFSAIESNIAIPEEEQVFDPASEVVQPAEAVEQEPISTGQAFKNAWELDGSVPALARVTANTAFKFDPNFELGDHADALVDDVPDGIKPVLYKALDNAQSFEHAVSIKDRTMEEVRLQNELNTKGGPGMAIRVATNLLDPGAWALTAVAAPFGAGVRASRWGNAVRLGAVAGAENAALEATVYASSTTRRPEDIMYAGLAGAVLGGGLGAILGGKGGVKPAQPGSANATRNNAMGAEASGNMDRLDEALVREAMGVPTAKPQGYAKATLEDVDYSSMKFLGQRQDGRYAAGEVNESMQDAVQTDSAGAMSIGADESNLQTHTSPGWAPNDVEDYLKSYPKQAKAGWQWGMSGQAAASPNKRINVMGDMMMENAVGNVGHETSHAAASEIAGMYHEVAEATFAKGWQAELPAWRKEQGLSYIQGELPGNRYEFMKAVGKAQRTGVGSPAELKAAEGLNNALEYIFKQAKRGNIEGFEADKIHDANYFPRILDNERIAETSRTLKRNAGPGEMSNVAEEWVRRAVVSAQPEIDPGLAQRLAKHYITGARRRATGEGGEMIDLGTKNLEVLKAQLKDMEMSDDDISDVMHLISKTDKRSSDTVARAKSRLLMDLEVEIDDVIDPNAGYRTVTQEDLFNQDAESILSSYAHSVGGMAAMGQRTKNTPFHIRSKSDFDRFRTQAREEEMGMPKRNPGIVKSAADTLLFRSKDIKGDIEILDLAWNRIMGIPIGDPTSAVNTGVRKMSAYNFAADMGNVWTAQTAEWGAVMSASGLKTMAQQMPGLRSIMKNMVDGKEATSHLASVMQAEIGTGTMRTRSQASLRGFDNDASSLASNANAWDAGVHKAGEVTAYMNHRVMEWQQRTVSTSMMQDFANVATGGKGKLTPQRLAGLGINKSMLSRISKMMNKHARSEDGTLIPGSKLHEPNFHAWKDLDARDALLHAIRRKSRKAVQENDIGQMHQKQLLSPMIRLATQFRSFIFAALPKQLLHNLHMKDIEATQYLLWTTLMAGVGNYARIQIINAGKEDADKRIDEALDPENFIKSSIARTAYMSILPGLIDTASQFVSGDPFFSQYRSSGLESTPIAGNPTVRRTGAAYNLGSGLLRMATDADYRGSKEDWRNARSIMPFNTLAPVSLGLNAIGATIETKRSEKGSYR